MVFQPGRTGEFPLAVLQAQVADIEHGHRATIIYNLVSFIFVILILHLDGGFGWPVALWFVLSFAILGIRLRVLRDLQKKGLNRTDPRHCLSVLSWGAFSLGLCWAALPFVVSEFAPLGQHTALMIIMGGMATGSVVRQIGYTPLALAYAVPILCSLIVSLLRHGQPNDLVICACLTLLIIVFIRRSIWTQHIFINSQIARHEATALADSLTRANSDILRQNSRLESLANRDMLTGLANRMFFHGRLNGDIARAAVLGETVALLIFDVERFQAINDTLGHSAGDALLREVGSRLENLVDDDSLIARLGGDEFAVIVSGSNAVERARLHAARVLEASRTPLCFGQHRATVGLSVGLAAYPDHAGSAEELLVSADMALYEAKRGDRRKLGEFDPELRLIAERKRLIEQDLGAAIDSGALGAWFQPQVDLASRRITGFEALVRWQHPQLGFIAPPDIVNAAQAMHLSERLTARIAGDACALAKQLPGMGLDSATVALNVSPREFALYSVADMLEEVTAIHAVCPAALEIEITEEAILDPALADAQLKRLEEAGYKLAVDDFGMGHSSLAYLISLKIDRLKIDRSFVKDVARSETNQKLVTAMVSLGQSLGLDIVVEGVETQEDATVLARLGCTMAQGYLFARPMPPKALATWITEHQATVVKRRRKTGHLSVA
jgi:diguanylate cyclase (GGDEF)-like protein